MYGPNPYKNLNTKEHKKIDKIERETMKNKSIRVERYMNSKGMKSVFSWR
jgi:hypothetical protein